MNDSTVDILAKFSKLITMKPRIDLYLLNADNFNGCLSFAYQLAEKAYQLGHSLRVQLQSTELAEAFDQMLWTFRPASFLPHQRTSQEAEILLGPLDANAAQVVLNLRLSPEPECGSWARLLQIVPNQADLLQLARQHYRSYQKQGCQLITHRIS